LRFAFTHGTAGFIVLGAVVLAVTGAEALYADMGHFGKRPIRLAWFAMVLPALLINYFGQGALVLRDPAAAENPFFLLAPRVMLYPLIALATMAAIIASQAMISGAFSLTQQCIQLGFLAAYDHRPHVGETEGQIYIPESTALMGGVPGRWCWCSGRSSNLAAAYGIAVTGDDDHHVGWCSSSSPATRWGWPMSRPAALVCLFLSFDLTFFGSQRGEVPPRRLAARSSSAAALFAMMTDVEDGRAASSARFMIANTLPLDLFLDDVKHHAAAPRVKGRRCSCSPTPTAHPPVLLHHLKHNQVLHKQVVLLSIRGDRAPPRRAPSLSSITVRDVGRRLLPGSRPATATCRRPTCST
jgi:KUP system potassium uptake protein